METKNEHSKSPLRYPGGKSKALKAILPFIPKETKTLFSPFIGGGSVELACASLGIKVRAADIFDPLVHFWNLLLSKPDHLADRVAEFYPLSKEEFYAIQKEMPSLSKVDSGVGFYIMNRSSFSGTTLSGGMSPGHPRFTPSSIQRVRTFKAPNLLSVTCQSFEESIPEHEKDFLYLDPPYANDQLLYGTNGDAHKGFDHEGLARILKGRGRWLMSYNDSIYVRKLYVGYEIKEVVWNYGMSKDKRSNEILIFSKD